MTAARDLGLARGSATAGNFQFLQRDHRLLNRLDVTIRRGEDGADVVEALDGAPHVGAMVLRGVAIAVRWGFGPQRREYAERGALRVANALLLVKRLAQDDFGLFHLDGGPFPYVGAVLGESAPGDFLGIDHRGLHIGACLLDAFRCPSRGRRACRNRQCEAERKDGVARHSRRRFLRMLSRGAP